MKPVIRHHQETDPALLYIIKGSYSEDYSPARRMHSHSFVEIHYAVRGRSTCDVENERIITEPDTLVIYNAEEFHAENPLPGEEVSFYSIALNHFKNEDLPDNHLIHDLHSHAVHLGRFAPLFRELIRSLFHESKAEKQSAVNTCSLQLMTSIIRTLLDETEELRRKESKTDSEYAAERIRQYICYHFDEDITLESIASIMHTSVSTVSHAFRRHMQLSPLQYLQRIRIGEAQTLLGSSDLSIREIAIRVGYNSPENMYLAFRKHTGMSPSEYRTSQKQLQG